MAAANADAAGERIVISGNASDGVYVFVSGQNVVAGVYIGPIAAGSGAVSNGGDGVQVNAAGANTIGGTGSAALRNVISGNIVRGIEVDGHSAYGNVMEGNDVGTDVTGIAGLGNSGDGISLIGAGTGNIVGGTVAGAGNVIAANGREGIYDDNTNGTLIAGNMIGVNAAGTAPLGNGLTVNLMGISIAGSSSPTRRSGGTTAGARNVISGNTNGYGVRAWSAAPATSSPATTSAPTPPAANRSPSPSAGPSPPGPSLSRSMAPPPLPHRLEPQPEHAGCKHPGGPQRPELRRRQQQQLPGDRLGTLRDHVSGHSRRRGSAFSVGHLQPYRDQPHHHDRHALPRQFLRHRQHGRHEHDRRRRRRRGQRDLRQHQRRHLPLDQRQLRAGELPWHQRRGHGRRGQRVTWRRNRRRRGLQHHRHLRHRRRAPGRRQRHLRQQRRQHLYRRRRRQQQYRRRQHHRPQRRNGTASVGNASVGVRIFTSATNNRVGVSGVNATVDAGERNIIAGAGASAVVFDTSAANNVVAGNYIGINEAGTAVITDNGDDVLIKGARPPAISSAARLPTTAMSSTAASAIRGRSKFKRPAPPATSSKGTTSAPTQQGRLRCTTEPSTAWKSTPAPPAIPSAARLPT